MLEAGTKCIITKVPKDTTLWSHFIGTEVKAGGMSADGKKQLFDIPLKGCIYVGEDNGFEVKPV